jgi:hypothetical protein
MLERYRTMKNSLFMRAVAAAAAVPVALTQCLTVASAVSVTSVAPAIANDALVTASDANTITLTGNDGLLYIEPKEILKNVYVQDEKDPTIFTKDSRWNVLIDGYIKNAPRQSGKIDPEFVVSTIKEKAATIGGGKFDEVASFGLDALTKEDITYEIVDGDIVIKAHVAKPDFAEDVKNFIGGAMKELADSSKIESLAHVNYSADPSGDFTITIHTANIATDTNIAVDFAFVPTSTGKAIGFGQLPEFVLDILDSLTKDAEDAINASSLTDVQKEENIKKINGTNGKYGMNDYKKAVIKANNAIDKAKNAEKSFTADSVKQLIAAVNKQILKRNIRGIKKQIPESASAIMSNEMVKKAYDGAVAQFNKDVEGYNIDIAADLLGAEVDRLYDISGSTNKGTVNAFAKYPDDEKADVEKFFAESEKYNTKYTFVDSWKEIKVEANFSNIDEVEAGSADIKYYRVVKVQPKDVVTTTTTSTTTITDTTTTTIVTSTETEPVTSTSTEPVTTEPVTTETEPVTTVTEPVTTEPVTTETEPVTTVTEPVTTVTEPVTTETEPVTTETEPVTTETETVTSTSTQPVTTETEPVTSTSTTEEVVVPGTTRTTIVNVPVIKADKIIGFYLDIDEEFHKEQVNKLTCSVDTVRQYIDEDNTVLKYESISTGDPIDITDKFDFGFATPVNTYNEADLTFAYQIALKATEDIKDSDGTVLIAKGSTFKNPDNSDVSVTAYIGVKGDANLDNKVDSGDATTTLIYYSKISTGEAVSDTQFSISNLVKGPDDILDHFVTFLCDTTNEPYPQIKDASPDNWKLMKGDRKILADDASYILKYYTELSLQAPKGRETWNAVQNSDND